MQCPLLKRTANPTAQWFYSPVSGESLQKTGIPQWLSGDYPGFRKIVVRIRSLWRLSMHKKPAIGGPFSRSGKKFSETWTGWLGREDSNLRMGESKSPALPLGDAPIAPNGSQRDLVSPPHAVQCRKVAAARPSGHQRPRRFTVAAEVFRAFCGKVETRFSVTKCCPYTDFPQGSPVTPIR